MPASSRWIENLAEGITLTDVAEGANEEGIILRNKSPLPLVEKSQGLCFALLKREIRGEWPAEAQQIWNLCHRMTY